MAEIVLTTLNARYAHAAFGLRYLMANLGALRERAVLLEFDINQRPIDMLEQILAQNPRIVGLGVYIWNVEPATRLVADLKRVRPEVVVIVGGPEVSYEMDQQEICRIADYVISGEADLAFAEVCRGILEGRRTLMKVIAAELPEFEGSRGEPQINAPRLSSPKSDERRSDQKSMGNGVPLPMPPDSPARIKLPYELYDERDVAHRVIYVEASRGCPFKCEFCLSSLDVPVRNVPLEAFLEAMQALLERGVRHFKFVDRTFNLNLKIGQRILAFFLERYQPGLFLHFEMIPDRLPEGLRELIRKFPAGALQFEVGIQTFNEEVSERISRRQDNLKVEENLRFLRAETGVHVHADLIVGLPGEDLASFAAGFDRLVALGPQEIQVGILKRLRGTPIVRHDQEWGMIYSPHAPYEVLATKTMSFEQIQKMRRFARYWDLVANSGNFVRTTPLIWRDASAFEGFMRWSEWLFEKCGRTHAIALNSLAQMLLEYLTGERGLAKSEVTSAMEKDLSRERSRQQSKMKRQGRHLRQNDLAESH